MASLPPLSSEVFTDKVVTAQASSTAAAARASFEKGCETCQKTYYSENAFQNHVGSQKHKLRLVASRTGALDKADKEANSVVSSTFSLGELMETGDVQEETDPAADAEFSEVVDAFKKSSMSESEMEPISSRPTRPHHSADNESSAHPNSPETPSSTSPTSQGSPGAAATTFLPGCLFCNYSSPSLSLNVLHMGKIHGMFIPEQPYLVDLPGLVRHLREKIFTFHECLYCGKIKGTTSGVQTHMRDKGHCMIGFDSEEEMVEIGQFYDFRSSYPDSNGGDDEDDDDDDDKGTEKSSSKKKAAGRVGLVARGQEGVEMATAEEDTNVDGDGWETDSSASSLDSAELTAVPLDDHRHQYQRLDKHPHHSHNDPRPHHNKDGWHSHAHIHPHAVYYADYELHLPSGRSIGHRSLARYYRQNLHGRSGSDAASQLRALTDGSSADAQALEARRGRQPMAVTRANGGQGMDGVTDAKKREVKAVETRERQRETRLRASYQWGVEKRGNQQKHFRVSPCRCRRHRPFLTDTSAGQDPLLQ